MKFRIIETKRPLLSPTFKLQVKTGWFWWSIDREHFQGTFIDVNHLVTNSGRCTNLGNAKLLIEKYKHLLEVNKSYEITHKIES